MNASRFPHRYCYERLDTSGLDANRSTTNGTTATSSSAPSLYIFLNYNSAPSELPFIEGYKFNGRMNLTAGDSPLPTLTNSTPPVGPVNQTDPDSFKLED